MKKNFYTGAAVFLILSGQVSAFEASEVIPKTDTAVVVREHPKTGKPYVSIVRTGRESPAYAFQQAGPKFSRPDYRMLDPDVKSGETGYDGPFSSRKKVYAFAASLAAGGALGGALLPVAPATGAAASGGAGAFAAAGTGVAAGSLSAASWASRKNPEQDDFKHSSETKITDRKSTTTN